MNYTQFLEGARGRSLPYQPPDSDPKKAEIIRKRFKIGDRSAEEALRNLYDKEEIRIGTGAAERMAKADLSKLPAKAKPGELTKAQRDKEVAPGPNKLTAAQKKAAAERGRKVTIDKDRALTRDERIVLSKRAEKDAFGTEYVDDYGDDIEGRSQRALDITSGSALRQTKVDAERDAAIKDLDKPGPEPKNKEGAAYKRWLARSKAYQDALDDIGPKEGLDDAEDDPRSLRKRMAGALDSGRGEKGDIEANLQKGQDELVRAAEAPAQRQPLVAPDGTVLRQPGTAHEISHRYPRDVLPKKVIVGGENDNVDEFVDAFMKVNLNPDAENRGIKPTASELQGKGGIEQTTSKYAVPREIEALDPRARKAAKERGLGVDPEIAAQEDAVRKAMEPGGGGAPEVMKTLKRYSDEETKAIVDGIVKRFGRKSTGKSELLSTIESLGIGSDERRMRAANAGAGLFPDGVPDKYKPKMQQDDGTYVVDEDAPDGVIDLYALNQDVQKKKDKKLQDIYNQALENHGLDYLSNYVQIGMVDMYQPSGGMVPIKDVDYEHIDPLRGDEGGAGYDAKGNVLPGSSRVNQGRGTRAPGSGFAAKYADPEPAPDSGIAKSDNPILKARNKVYDDFMAAAGATIDPETNPELFDKKGNPKKGPTSKYLKDLGKQLKDLGTDEDLDDLTSAERKAKRKAAQEIGMSAKQAEIFFPKTRSAENPVFQTAKGGKGKYKAGRFPGQVILDPATGKQLGGRLDRRSVTAAPEASARDIITDRKDEQQFKIITDYTSTLYPNLRREKDLINTDEGKDLMRQFAALERSDYKPEPVKKASKPAGRRRTL